MPLKSTAVPHEMQHEPLLGDFMPVIGLFAQDRAGKDTAASYLVERYGFYRRAFADSMKEAMAVLNPIVALSNGVYVRVGDFVEEHGEDELKKWSSDYRELMIRFGTGLMREHMGYNRVWMDKLVHHVDGMRNWHHVPNGLVIPDVRDPLEAKIVVEELGGYVIELRSDRGQGFYGDEAQVAKAREYVTYTVSNNATISDLHLQLDRMLAGIFRDYNVDLEEVPADWAWVDGVDSK